MTYNRIIRFSDTDAAGVVYFASLLSICHEAYENALETAGIDLKTFFQNTDIAVPIVHAEIDFYQPLFCGDRLQISLIPTQLNDTEFEIAYEILTLSSSTVCLAKAKTKHVSINPLIRKRTPLPSSLIQWLQTAE
ncbi:thioesterase family protein [Crocosphaera sp. UHCC 0190]|uniref:acyl-CoA thioesterase n=1 Tax=Crocosphaera sp. UHCC 0190 TaxID=3110246 RepID=UPI002B202E8D|nr:thioesterase family protein [Crocosphaera sp. UHCC 0190]MEA5510583.1 thioesterase family protein [Crocosphaera sp. UHCC 0190]